VFTQSSSSVQQFQGVIPSFEDFALGTKEKRFGQSGKPRLKTWISGSSCALCPSSCLAQKARLVRPNRYRQSLDGDIHFWSGVKDVVAFNENFPALQWQKVLGTSELTTD